jgi:hypothetical protein
VEKELVQSRSKLMKTEFANRMKHFIAELKQVVFQPPRYAMMKRWVKEMCTGNRHHTSLSLHIPFGCLLEAGVNLVGRQSQDFR